MPRLTEAIAWTLIHFCWQATVVAGIYRLVSRALNRRSSQSRYLLALAAMLAMLAAAAGTLAWQVRPFAPTPTLSAASTATPDMLPTGFPQSMQPGFIRSHMSTEESSRTTLLRWIDGFWLLGVVVLSVRGLGGWWFIRRLSISGDACVPASLLSSFRRISSAMGLSHRVRLRLTGAVAGPIAIGVLRGMVLLPFSAVTLLGPDELEVVLAHELAHIRRADFFWNLVQTLVETLLFFHPAVWWIGSCIRKERELCCDDLALKFCPNPLAYANALFRLEQQRAQQWRLAMALDGHQSSGSLRVRIARILGEASARDTGRSIQPISLLVACVGLVLLLVPAPRVLASLHPVPPAATAVTAPSANNLAPKLLRVHPSLRVLSPLITTPTIQTAGTEPQQKSEEPAEAKSSYIDRMKAAGYDVDLDKYVGMKIQGVTPEFARAMSQVGLGKPSADDLIACKIHGVTPEYLSQLKQQGLEVKSFQDAISFRIFEVRPEFVAGMKAAGFSDLSSQQLLSLRVQGVTPEYAKQISQQFPGATVDDVIRTRIFNIDANFIETAKKHGFTDLTLEKLVRLRISGLLDDESVKQPE
jgi:beta-lactamase regulating signal transducer with metallopeptidase domain